MCKSSSVRYIEREREREREREKQIYINPMTTTVTTTFTKGYKVTLYSDEHRATALYTIYRNSVNLDCPRENVNTAIIHSYSTGI